MQFPRAQLRVSSTLSGENIKSYVRVKDPKTGEQLTYGYTDLQTKKNPIEFILPPGLYEVIVEPSKIEGANKKVFNIELNNQDSKDIEAEFSE